MYGYPKRKRVFEKTFKRKKSTVEKLSTFYKNKKVFVTGHTGFKGSWLTLLLNELGAKVVGLALQAEKPQSLYEDAKIASLLDAEYIQDIRDSEKVGVVIDEENVDYVFHLAARVRPLIRGVPIQDLHLTGVAQMVLAEASQRGEGCNGTHSTRMGGQAESEQGASPVQR